MSGQAESSTAATILRNDDPLTLALRNGDALDIDDIARLDRAMSPAYDASSLGTSSSAVFTAHDNSTITKPTSTGTPYPNNGYKGKGKAKASYPSSLSVAYGSGSEAEAQRNTVRRDALFAMGDWTAGDPVPTEPLKGSARAKTRRRSDRHVKHKKPVVKIIQHGSTAPASSESDSVPRGNDQVVTVAHAHDTTGKLLHSVMASYLLAHSAAEKKYLRRRATQHDEDQVRLAEEGQIHRAPVYISPRRSLSPTRAYLLAGLTVLMILTITLSFYGARQTGKGRIACTKEIVFGATVLLAFFIVLAMMVARRAVHEALLAGLLETVIGFTLLLELDDFM